MNGGIMRQARATRYYAEARGGSSYMDTVEVESATGSFEMEYTNFVELFRLEIQKGGEILFQVETKRILEKNSDLPR